MQTNRGAESPEELKQLFLQYLSDDDVEMLMSLYFQRSAPNWILDLYRRSFPSSGERIATAQIIDFSDDRLPGKEPSTLKPEKLLLLQFGKKRRKGPVCLEQWFPIGQHKGRYYFTMPTGKSRPMPKANLANFRKLVKVIAAILVSEIPARLNDKRWRFKNKEWSSACLDKRWSAGGGASIAKLCVFMSSGRVFTRAGIPNAVDAILDDIKDIKDKAFADKWYGLKITVHPDGNFRSDRDHNPECVHDPTFFTKS